MRLGFVSDGLGVMPLGDMLDNSARMGVMNWQMIARALHDMEYDGPVGMQAFAKDDPQDALNAFTL